MVIIGYLNSALPGVGFSNDLETFVAVQDKRPGIPDELMIIYN